MEHRASPAILVAVDGNNLLHRAHHGWKNSNRRDSEGNAIWALDGTKTLIDGVVQAVEAAFRAPLALVVAFDGDKTKCVRRAEHPGYKAGRSAPDEDLKYALGAAPDWFASHGYDVVIRDGYEADDVVARLATDATSLGWRCVIATNDRDALGLVAAAVRVARPAKRGEWEMIGLREIAERYDLPAVAGTYAQYAALRGDPSDGLEGVAGVGAKTAAKVVTECHNAGGTLADFYAGRLDLSNVLTARQIKLLVDGEANWKLARQMMEPRTPFDLTSHVAPNLGPVLDAA